MASRDAKLCRHASEHDHREPQEARHVRPGVGDDVGIVAVSAQATIQQTNARLYRAYLLKEQLRQIYQLPARAGERLLDRWLDWARRCRLPSFVKLARTITTQREGILAAVKHGLSNARIEQLNTQIRLIARRAFGFHSPAPLIALAMLKLAELCPPLPR